MSRTLKYEGCCMFRQRVIAATMSGRSLKIERIRDQEDEPGLKDFEASFLRLVERLTDGCHIEINDTGTTLKYKPGITIGGSHTHNCGTSRGIGWYLEGILPLTLFSKEPVHLVLEGITNDTLDLSVDTLRNVTLPLLGNFGVYHAQLNVKRRGALPKGGGIVEFSMPIRGKKMPKALTPLHVTEEGLVKRVRGTAFGTKISPTVLTRVIDACRGVLNDYLPDVHIHTDHFKGKDGGDSPGYALSLVAETTTGVLLSVERTAKPRINSNPSSSSSTNLNRSCIGFDLPAMTGLRTEKDDDLGRSGQQDDSSSAMDLPEDLGRETAFMLLDQILEGGVVDRMHQPLVLTLMVLTPEDVSKVRLGRLTLQAKLTLRLLRDAFGVTFKIQEDALNREKIPIPTPTTTADDDDDAADDDDGSSEDEESEEEEEEEGMDVDQEESESNGEKEGEQGSDDDGADAAYAEWANADEGEDEDEMGDEEQEQESEDEEDASSDTDDDNDDDEDDAYYSDAEERARAKNLSAASVSVAGNGGGIGGRPPAKKSGKSTAAAVNQKNNGKKGKGRGRRRGREQEQQFYTRTTLLLSCLGAGYENVNRKVT